MGDLLDWHGVMSACGHADMRADEIEYGFETVGFEVVPPIGSASRAVRGGPTHSREYRIRV
jgi:hypothetical protein